MRLYFSNDFLGDIHNVIVDGMWLNGKINPSKNIDRFTDLFEALSDEDIAFEESNYDEKWLDENNWYVIDAENRKKGISIPTVYTNSDIHWRWR